MLKPKFKIDQIVSATDPLIGTTRIAKIKSIEINEKTGEIRYNIGMMPYFPPESHLSLYK